MDAKRKRLIEDALNEATRGCTCGMGVAECDRCREVVLVEALEDAMAERDKMRDVLLRNNFAPCDTQACNCNGWHELSTGNGFYARFREIEEAIGDHNGKTLLAAVVEMVQERDALKAKLASKGACDIATERARQVEKWDSDHDDEHSDGTIAVRAAELAIAHTWLRMFCSRPDDWGLLAKHQDTRQRLVIAGALIAAEIDRLDRAAAKVQP